MKVVKVFVGQDFPFVFECEDEDADKASDDYLYRDRIIVRTVNMGVTYFNSDDVVALHIDDA